MGISTETLVCEDMTSCTDLACRHVVDEIAAFCHCSAKQQLLYNCSKYFLDKRCGACTFLAHSWTNALTQASQPSHSHSVHVSIYFEQLVHHTECLSSHACRPLGRLELRI